MQQKYGVLFHSGKVSCSSSILMRIIKLQKLKRGSTRSGTTENSLWKKLWTCHKADRMNILYRLCGKGVALDKQTVGILYR
jgi:hypothetical protein